MESNVRNKWANFHEPNPLGEWEGKTWQYQQADTQEEVHEEVHVLITVAFAEMVTYICGFKNLQFPPALWYWI